MRTFKESFLFELDGRNMSKNTIKNYNITLTQLENYYKTKDIHLLDREDLLEFLSPYNANTRNAKLSCLRSFFGWATEISLIKEDPTLTIKNAKVKDKYIKVLPKDKLIKIVDIESNLMYKAIWAIFCTCALRVEEVTKLNREDIFEFDGQKMMRVFGKGGKVREIPLPENALKWLNYYLKTRKDNYRPLFINSWGNRVSVSSIQKRLTEIGEKIGVENLYPHLLRHSVATYLAASGMNAFQLQQFLGHSDIKTTQIYIHMAEKMNMKSYDLLSR